MSGGPSHQQATTELRYQSLAYMGGENNYSIPIPERKLNSSKTTYVCT